jgi:hypothetical protein
MPSSGRPSLNRIGYPSGPLSSNAGGMAGVDVLISSALGSTFHAGIPCRDRLVLFSDRKALKVRIGRRLRQDYKASPYPITPQPFLVTRDDRADPLPSAASRQAGPHRSAARGGRFPFPATD